MTAVEWLVEQILNNKGARVISVSTFYIKDEIVEQAKEMEKQQQAYSEEDLRNAYRWGTQINQGTKEHFNEWFKQFKNK